MARCPHLLYYCLAAWVLPGGSLELHLIVTPCWHILHRDQDHHCAPRPTRTIISSFFITLPGAADDPEELDSIVPAVTRLALLHRELERERAKNVEAVEELIEFQRSEFGCR